MKSSYASTVPVTPDNSELAFPSRAYLQVRVILSWMFWDKRHWHWPLTLALSPRWRCSHHLLRTTVQVLILCLLHTSTRTKLHENHKLLPPERKQFVSMLYVHLLNFKQWKKNVGKLYAQNKKRMIDSLQGENFQGEIIGDWYKM